jgi:hypothetical protein
MTEPEHPELPAELWSVTDSTGCLVGLFRSRSEAELAAHDLPARLWDDHRVRYRVRPVYTDLAVRPADFSELVYTESRERRSRK